MTRETMPRLRPIAVGINRPALSEKAPLGSWIIMNMRAKIASSIPTWNASIPRPLTWSGSRVTTPPKVKYWANMEQ